MDSNGTLWHERCPVCQSPRPAWDAMPRYHHARLTHCRQCRHVFAGSYPTATELAQHYGGYPRIPCRSPITLRRYEEILDALERYRRVGRLLDVGCGVGDFLVAARARDWEVHGVELEQRARAICTERGLSVTAAPLDPGEYAPASFDVVSAFEVLEHMVAPRREMRAVTEILRPGGMLYLTTPNFASLSRRLLGPRYGVITYPEHLGYFQPHTLHRLLVETGLERVDLRSTGFSPGQVWDALHRGSPSARKSVDESVRAALERPGLKLTKRLVNHGLAQLAAGDSLVASYRRASACRVGVAA